MSGFISKYSGEEIEGILDKADSIEVGLNETNNGIPFNTITVNGVVYKIPSGQQLGLYKHSIKFSINVSVGGDSPNNISIDNGDNIVKFDVFSTSSIPLTLDNVFDSAKTLCFGKIVYNKRTSPKTLFYCIMIGWEVFNDDAYKIKFLYADEETDTINASIDFYARDFSDTVVEVVAN